MRASDKTLDMTITTLTNALAADISQAIRERLKKRGQISRDEKIHKAVYYKGDKPEFFDLPIATGDKLRLYRRTWVKIDGKGRAIGNNGDIVEVAGTTAEGLLLRNQHGHMGEVQWRRLSDPITGRLLLGFGRAFTVDAAHGMSIKGEHINALPHKTAGSSAFKTYSGESRATGRTYTLISKAAVHDDVRRGRALGDPTLITEDNLWKRIVKDTSDKPYKALAIDLAAAAGEHPRRPSMLPSGLITRSRPRPWPAPVLAAKSAQHSMPPPRARPSTKQSSAAPVCSRTPPKSSSII